MAERQKSMKPRIITTHKDRVCFQCKKAIKAETDGVHFISAKLVWCTIDCYLDTKEKVQETNEQMRDRWARFKNDGYIICATCKNEVAQDRLKTQLVPIKNGSLMVKGICPICGNFAKWVTKKHTKFKEYA